MAQINCLLDASLKTLTIIQESLLGVAITLLMDFHPWDTMSMSEPPWKCREGMGHNAVVEYLLDVH